MSTMDEDSGTRAGSQRASGEAGPTGTRKPSTAQGDGKGPMGLGHEAVYCERRRSGIKREIASTRSIEGCRGPMGLPRPVVASQSDRVWFSRRIED